MNQEAVESWAEHFGDFDQRVWLNTAHQGAVPLVAAEAAREAVSWKLSPQRLTSERFRSVPQRLRRALAELIGAVEEDVVLANGASHGQHLWADGLGLKKGDEVLLMRGDFPSCRLPWQRLAREGVEVRDVPSAGPVPTKMEVEAAITERTKVLSMSWVHSFSGVRADLKGIGGVCREAGVAFLVNTTQGLGNLQLDVSKLAVDAVTNAGWKWLCGPYGTGFCWMRPEFRERLDSRRAYWLAFQTADDLMAGVEPDPDREVGARRFDLFSPANFFQFHPWAESIELLLDIGVAEIERHDLGLAERAIGGLDLSLFDRIGGGPAQSAIVVMKPLKREASQIAAEMAQAGFDLAVRRGCLRIAPHLYNSADQIDRVVQQLNTSSA